MRSLTEAEIREIIRDELSKVFASVLPAAPKQQKDKGWQRPKEAAIELRLTEEQLRRRRENGWFAEGVHYRIANNNPKAKYTGVRYEYHVEKCAERMSERRSKWKVS